MANLVVNPGAEDSLSGWTHTSWSATTAVSVSGTRSFVIGETGGWLNQTITTVSNTTYVFSAYSRVSTTSQQIFYIDNARKIYLTNKGTSFINNKVNFIAKSDSTLNQYMEKQHRAM